MGRSTSGGEKCRKIVEDLSAHIVYCPLVYSKISYGMIEIIELSCTFNKGEISAINSICMATVV